MIPILALDVDGPLMLMFGILLLGVLGAAGGYILGTTVGRTQPETPLPATLRVTRERLASTCASIGKASGKLNEARRSELAGSALVIERRIAELSEKLGHLERKAKRSKEGAS